MTKSALRGITRAVLFLTWTGLLVPPYLLLFMLGRPVRRPFIKLWHRGVCHLIGLKVTRYGTPHQGKRVLLAGNHISYLDIPILASCHDITFVAKSDVAHWPVFGFLARIAQTAFIERTPNKARQQKHDLQDRLLSGEHLMIFPEGTSSAGDSVLAFKTSLFEIAMTPAVRDDCILQPVSLSFCTGPDGRPLTQDQRDLFAWYGDMTLAPHLWRVFCLNGCHVSVIFHPPMRASDFDNRKAASHWVETRVRHGLSSLQGDEKHKLYPIKANNL